MAMPIGGCGPHLYAVTPRDGSTLHVQVQGRDRWALECLRAAGDDGCTPINQPAPRWSAYVWNLRQRGIEVETVHEQHGGPFPGRHARYVLRSRVEPVKAAERRAA